MLSQVAPEAAGVPGVQLSVTPPPKQSATPAHAPTPQLVATGAKSSSSRPSQSSSMLSQVASDGAGVPGVQVSPTMPPEQTLMPDAAHAPTPHVVGSGT